MKFDSRKDFDERSNRAANWILFIQPMQDGMVHTYRGFKVVSGDGYWHIEGRETEYADFEGAVGEIEINLVSKK